MGARRAEFAAPALCLDEAPQEAIFPATALAYYAGAIDGLAGPETRSAITTFQRRQAQPATGAVTPGLLDRLCVCVSAYQRCTA